jgi:hypothetical protein
VLPLTKIFPCSKEIILEIEFGDCKNCKGIFELAVVEALIKTAIRACLYGSRAGPLSETAR